MTSFSKNVFSIELVPRLLPEPRRDVTDEEAETVYLRIQRPEYSNETIDVGIESAPNAFLKLFKGENFGKMLVKIAEE